MIRVTCAIIRNEDNEVLVVQRGEATDHPFKWEFPGGKLTSGETEEECIIREVDEELSIDVVICGKLPEVEYDYGIKQIKLIPFICDTLDELPFLSEHLAYKWLPAMDLMSVDFSEADVFVAKSYLEKFKDQKNPEKIAVSEPETSLIDDADLQSMIKKRVNAREVEWVAASAVENPAVFSKLFEYSYSDDKKLAFHSSWTLTKVCDRYPDLIYPYLTDMIETLSKLDNDSALRSFLRIISLSDFARINTSLHGILADFCFNMLNSANSAIAVKAYSMEILYQLSVIYPEMANELSASIHILMEDGTAAITSRGRMILKKLREFPINSKSTLK